MTMRCVHVGLAALPGGAIPPHRFPHTRRRLYENADRWTLD